MKIFRSTVQVKTSEPTRLRVPQWGIVATLFVFALTWGSVAHAETDEPAKYRNVHVLQQRPVLQSLRLELVPEFGYTINDVMHHYLQTGGTMRFHINEEFSVAGSYGHYFAQESATYKQVQDEFSLFPERSFIRWYAGGQVDYTPIYGKFILFGASTIHWNASFSLGAGATKTWAKSPLFTGMLGFNTRFFLTRWLTFNLSLKDYIYTEPYKQGDEIMNNLVLHAGFGVFVPFDFKYQYPK